MNIIFVSNNMAKARALTHWQVMLFLVLLVMGTAFATAALILPQAASSDQSTKPSFSRQLVNAVKDSSQAHLNAMGLQLGEIQARLMRLDALSERLAQLAGIKEQERSPESVAGRGGPIVHPHNPDAKEIEQLMAQTMRDLDMRGDQLEILEAMLLQQRLRSMTVPSSLPVLEGYHSSGFGWRTDPLTGQLALHEGLDFAAEKGTPIYAAADGVVAQSGRVADYGNIVKIDHGGGLETRYAHASRLLVKAGERVEKGQLIAEVGSTGRSTGAHLHFEVRLNGVALNPRKYLQNSKS